MSTDQDFFNDITNPATTAETPVEVMEETPSDASAVASATDGESETEDRQPATPEAGSKEPPPHRFREVSEARRKAEAENAELRAQLNLLKEMRQLAPQHLAPVEAKKPVEPPEFWEDPNAAMQHRIDPVSQQLMQTREIYSRKFAETQHGAEKVNEAYQALDAAIRSGAVDGEVARQQLMSSMDPFGDIMTWHSRHSILSEIGNDPKAYEQKIQDRALADPAFLARAIKASKGQQAAAPSSGASVVRLPPSLTRVTAAASNNSQSSGDLSDSELFAQTTNRRR